MFVSVASFASARFNCCCLCVFLVSVRFFISYVLLLVLCCLDVLFFFVVVASRAFVFARRFARRFVVFCCFCIECVFNVYFLMCVCVLWVNLMWGMDYDWCFCVCECDVLILCVCVWCIGVCGCCGCEVKCVLLSVCVVVCVWDVLCVWVDVCGWLCVGDCVWVRGCVMVGCVMVMCGILWGIGWRLKLENFDSREWLMCVVCGVCGLEWWNVCVMGWLMMWMCVGFDWDGWIDVGRMAKVSAEVDATARCRRREVYWVNCLWVRLWWWWVMGKWMWVWVMGMRCRWWCWCGVWGRARMEVRIAIRRRRTAKLWMRCWCVCWY